MFKDLTKEELERRIEEETALIEELESKPCPEYKERTRENNWCPDNSAYWAYMTPLNDAYWRRRMLRTKIEGDDIKVAARAG